MRLNENRHVVIKAVCFAYGSIAVLSSCMLTAKLLAISTASEVPVPPLT